MDKIRVLVIDDERSAREELKRSLRAYPEYEIVGESRNAEEAKQQIEGLKPDLIFLDIQMPEGSGFDLLESLVEVPQVIFTTAFDQYAVRAFETNALDYLMKPVREERFSRALEKARIALQQAATGTPEKKQFFIRDGDKRYFIRMDEISLVESLENYSRVHFRGGKAILKKSLRQWELILYPTQFFRISRTEIVNLEYIENIDSISGSRLLIKLRSGPWLEISSRQSVKFRQLRGI
jgi:two-component system LytT family response regulator